MEAEQAPQGCIPAPWVGELQHGMRIGLRRISTCLRVCAMVTAGIGVAHGSAIRVNASENAEQMTEPTGSISLPESRAPGEATGIVGELPAAKRFSRIPLSAERVARLTQKGLAV